MTNDLQLGDLNGGELRALISDDRLPLAQQIMVIREIGRRAAVRRKAEEMAELVATVPVMTALDDSAEIVREAQAWLDEAKRERTKAVQAALAAGYSIRTVAEVARIAPSSAFRLGSQELPPEPPPA